MKKTELMSPSQIESLKAKIDIHQSESEKHFGSSSIFAHSYFREAQNKVEILTRELNEQQRNLSEKFGSISPHVIERLSKMSKHNDKPSYEIVIKIGEESGEVCKEYLAYTKSNGCDYREGSDDKVREECIDTIMTAMSLFIRMGGDANEFNEKLSTKLDKWAKVSGQTE